MQLFSIVMIAVVHMSLQFCFSKGNVYLNSNGDIYGFPTNNMFCAMKVNIWPN